MYKSRLLLVAFLTLFSFSVSAAQTTAVIGAMDVEIAQLLPEIEQRQQHEIGGHIYYSGKMRGHDVVVTRSGIGKVNAAITTTELIREFGADQILFTGIAGAVSLELEPADVVISTALVQHDVDLTVFGNKPGLIDGFDDRNFYANQELVEMATRTANTVVGNGQVFQGVIATGDQFIADKSKVKKIHKQFGAIAVEMEGAAVAQVAFLYDIPLVVIRTISDKADGSAHMDYSQLKQLTASNSAAITLKMLESM
ncbi:5'-methylthioadenosine/adenosylhomocysteine nucleosidase [Spongorhabdus nitratireducens]